MSIAIHQFQKSIILVVFFALNLTACQEPKPDFLEIDEIKLMKHSDTHSVLKDIEVNDHEWILNAMKKCEWIETDGIPLTNIFQFYRKNNLTIVASISETHLYSSFENKSWKCTVNKNVIKKLVELQS